MIIRTVLGDIEPDRAGVTFCHEHLIIDSPVVDESFPHIALPSVEEAVAELELCTVAGVGTMIDTMPLGSGGNATKLAGVSKRSGVHIVSSTGMHTPKYLPEGIDDSAERLADRFINEVAGGAGIIKLATTGEEPTDQERRLFAAGALAHLDTGAPIITHCEDGKGGLEQIAMLTEHGVAPGRAILSHTDKVEDLTYHRALLATGVNVVYDQALRQVEGESSTARLIATLLEDGFISQILLGTDGARRTLWSSLGGSPGLAWLATTFPLTLESHGVDSSDTTKMLVANPARILAFKP